MKRKPVSVKAAENWQSKIADNTIYFADPADLIANPKNFRVHPADQQAALTGSVQDLGWIDVIKVNKNTGNIIDGHLRVELAIRNAQESVPIIYLDLTEEEEAQALISLDPIAAMADIEQRRLQELIDISRERTENRLVIDFLETLQAENVGGAERLKETEVKVKPKAMAHILLSFSIDDALEVKEVIETLDKNKVEILYGAN